MRGVDLDLFDFDYDLTWMGFFLDADGRVLGRYGGRDADSAEGRVSLAGLRHAMQTALTAHRAGRRPAAPARRIPPRTVEDFPAVRRVPAGACVHFHQVYDFRREALQAAGKWDLDEVWVYPLPENVGLTLDVDRGSTVARVAADSPAARAGLRPGDVLTAVNGQAVATFADVQHALHRAPAHGKLTVAWQRGGYTHRGEMVPAPGWRKTDISWRWSLRGLDPPPWVQGDDLSAEEKKALGLGPRRLAVRQGPFVSTPARHAGLRPGDVLVGIDGKVLEMTARQFGAYVRLTYKVGDRVVYNVLRAGKRLDVPLKLEGRGR
jgi:hypothetical protein